MGSSDISVYEAKKLAEVNLLQETGIVGFGLSRTKGYKNRDVDLVNVYVEDYQTSLKVPKSIAGYMTNTVVTGKITALQSRTGRVRPVIGGISVGHYSITAGTLGAVVTKGGKKYILSNNHVLANCNNAKLGDPIYQPGKYDGGTPSDTVAQLTQFIPLNFSGEYNLVDCALAELIEPSTYEILGIGTVSGIEPAQVGMTVIKSGRTSGVTEATVTDVNATIKVGYGEGQEAIFEDQVVTSKLGDPGDSSSLVLNKANNNAVSLLFAGSDNVTVVNKIENVKRLLGFTFPGGQGIPPVEQSSIPLIIGLGLAGAVVYSAIKRKR